MPLLGPAGVFCAIAFAAGVLQTPGPAREMRTKVLPGKGTIRYEVQPGDDDLAPGELVVVPSQRRTPVAADAEAAPLPARRLEARRDDACRPARARLLVRLFQLRGMQVDEQFAEWLEQNVTVGERGLASLQIVNAGDSLLLTAVKIDGVARTLAEDVARCERSSQR